MAGGMLDQAQTGGAATGGAPAAAPVAPTTTDLAQAAAQAGAPGPQQGGALQDPAAAAQPAVAPAGEQAPVPVQMQGGMQGGKATGDMDIGLENATPEEQKEYERSMNAMAQVLYGNEKTSNAIVDQVDPNDKVSSTAKVSMLFMQQLDEKISMDESVVSQMTEETVTRIMELAENRHQLHYDESEAQVILSTTWEGISQLFGMDEAGHNELVNSVGADRLPQLKEQYEAALNG
jgi:hypothetical protein